MKNSVVHRSETRGVANHGWLQSKHTFSFANYYHPERMSFGVLRVLNDDAVSGGQGFGTHPHANMEIISIPLEGDLEHRDSMGNVTVIKNGDVQVMSAGTGVYHSEYNHSPHSTVKFLQIWVFPNKQNVTPRYDQLTLNVADRKNKLQQILSPSQHDEGVWIHQDAWFSLGDLDKETTIDYSVKSRQNGVYVFVLKGSVIIDGEQLFERDGYGIWDVETISIHAEEDSQVLLMDVPMN